MASRLHSYLLAASQLSLLLIPGIAAADTKDAPRAKIVEIAQNEANSRLRMRHKNECYLETPKDMTFVDPAAAVVDVRDSFYFTVSWKGKTAEGFEYDVSYDVARDGSGTFNPKRVKTTCPPKS